jgi:hypothetical protein
MLANEISKIRNLNTTHGSVLSRFLNYLEYPPGVLRNQAVLQIC